MFCRPHNKYEAEKTFGRAHVEKKIAERRAAATPCADPRILEGKDPRILEGKDPRILDSKTSATDARSTLRATLKSALVGLGFRVKEVDHTIAGLPNESWTHPIEDLVREALVALR